MIDTKILREHPEVIQAAIQGRGYKLSLDDIIDKDTQARDLESRMNALRGEQNAMSKGPDAKNRINELKKLKQEVQALEDLWKKASEELRAFLYQIPNLPRPDVKIGKDESENEVVKTWPARNAAHSAAGGGDTPKFTFPAKSYIELGEGLDIIDTKRAAKVSGSRFGYLKGLAAELEFALIQYVMSMVKKEGFIPVIPPVMISEEAMRAMGYMDRGKDEIFFLPQDHLYLTGTSEQSIGPMHMDEILDEKRLPLRYIGFSSCFRREAGSYGKDTKGILRVHQFDKLEMFSFTKPENSDAEHEYLLSLEEKIVQGLKIPYHVLKMCTGDLGDPAARKYDIECWLPSQNTYRETHSTSSCTDYQARRLNIRYKDSTTGRNQFVHTLNGTGIAIQRMIVMILEHYQQASGEIKIPNVLQPFMFNS